MKKRRVSLSEALAFVGLFLLLGIFIGDLINLVIFDVSFVNKLVSIGLKDEQDFVVTKEVCEEKLMDYPVRVELVCRKDYVGCNLGDKNFENITWNHYGCLVPLVEVESYVDYLPCSGFLKYGFNSVFCRYGNKEHFEMNIKIIERIAKSRDCDVDYLYDVEKICSDYEVRRKE